MTAVAIRPWYRLRWVTWLMLVVVGSALIYAQLQGRADGYESSFGYEISTVYGWPVAQFTVTEYGLYDLPLLGTPGPNYAHQWHWLAAAVNVAVALAFLGSTAFVLEKWLRSPKRLQFSLRSLLIVSAVIGILLALLSQTKDAHLGSLAFDLDLAPPLRWPLVLGLANALYASGWLASEALLGWLVNRSTA
jgi:hypothetical protein